MLYYLLCAVRSSLMAVIIDTNALTRETNALWLELDEELRLHKIAGGDKRDRTADLLNTIQALSQTKSLRIPVNLGERIDIKVLLPNKCGLFTVNCAIHTSRHSKMLILFPQKIAHTVSRPCFEPKLQIPDKRVIACCPYQSERFRNRRLRLCYGAPE